MIFPGKKKRGLGLDPDEIFADSVSALRNKESGTEGKIEKPLKRLVSILFLLVAGAGIIYLLYRAGELQIKEGRTFFSKSQENRFFVRSVLPPRGVIYDRWGEPLVENMPSFGLAFERQGFLAADKDLHSFLAELVVVLGKDISFFLDLGFPSDFDSSKLPRRIVITQNLSQDDLFRFLPHLSSFPGIEIFETYSRLYRYPRAAVHTLGFVGKVSLRNLEVQPGLSLEELVGKSGIEASYDSLLRGRVGKKIIEVDAVGSETRFRLVEESQAGRKLGLTLDGALQEKIYELLEHYIEGKKGASVVALDPRNGAVRALLSYPSFDGNLFGSALSQKEFEKIIADPLRPLFPRAIAGDFPSGSTIKPLIAAAALEEKIIDPQKQIYDEGFIEIQNPYNPNERAVFHDWKKHGWVDFYDALAQSANVYFYMIGGGYKDQRGLGIEKIKHYATLFGLGTRLGIDIPGEKEGLIPDPRVKAVLEPKDPTWRVGDTYNVSIGQGGVKVTPLQMTALTSAISNGGKLYKPYILQKIFDGGNDEKVSGVGVPQIIHEGMVSEATLKEVVKGMRQTVTEGTAWRLSQLPVKSAAKTGTAQAGSGLPHAWVTAFAPVDDPEIAITVMVEHAGEGSTVAVPIMYEILRWYFENHLP